jgi:Tol biopolymer transport system component
MNPKLRIFIMASIVISEVVLFSACADPDDGMDCVSPSIPDSESDEGSAARWLAFDSDRGTLNRDIYLVRDDGAQLTRLTTEPSFEKDPAFSHNGKVLAFASDRSGSMQIYAMDLAKGGVTQLTTLDAGADQPSWSGDDSRIVFHSGPSVYVMAADGSNPEVLVTGDDDFNAYEYPSFSLDEKEVIFSRRNEIHARNISTGAQRYVVPNWTTTEETPALSPDGRLVAFAVGCDVMEVISVTPFSGHRGDPCTAQRMTPPSAGSARRPSWATNNMMAFERSASSSSSLTTAIISVSEVPGSDPRDIVGPPGDNRNPSWAPIGFDPHQICL